MATGLLLPTVLKAGYGTAASAGRSAGWARTCTPRRRWCPIIAAGPTKVHLDVQFTRYRADNSVIGSFRSLWIVTEDSGRWAVAARSSFAD